MSPSLSVGAHTQEDRSTDEVGRFLSLVRFESREKVEELVKKRTQHYKTKSLAVRVPVGGYSQVGTHAVPARCNPKTPCVGGRLPSPSPTTKSSFSGAFLF